MYNLVLWLFTLKASNFVKWLISTSSFISWCQFFDWFKFETYPSSLRNFGLAYSGRCYKKLALWQTLLNWNKETFKIKRKLISNGRKIQINPRKQQVGKTESYASDNDFTTYHYWSIPTCEFISKTLFFSCREWKKSRNWRNNQSQVGPPEWYISTN